MTSQVLLQAFNLRWPWAMRQVSRDNISCFFDTAETLMGMFAHEAHDFCYTARVHVWRDVDECQRAECGRANLSRCHNSAEAAQRCADNMWRSLTIADYLIGNRSEVGPESPKSIVAVGSPIAFAMPAKIENYASVACRRKFCGCVFPGVSGLAATVREKYNWIIGVAEDFADELQSVALKRSFQILTL